MMAVGSQSGQDVGHLVGDEPEVDRHADRPEARAGEVGLDDLEGVEAEDGDAVTLAHAAVAQRVGQPAGPLVELAIGHPDVVVAEGDVVADLARVARQLVGDGHPCASWVRSSRRVLVVTDAPSATQRRRRRARSASGRSWKKLVPGAGEDAQRRLRQRAPPTPPRARPGSAGRPRPTAGVSPGRGSSVASRAGSSGSEGPGAKPRITPCSRARTAKNASSGSSGIRPSQIDWS